MAEALLFPDVPDPAVKALYLSMNGPSPSGAAPVLRQGCTSVFVRSVNAAIRMEGAEVSKPAPAVRWTTAASTTPGHGRASA